MAREQPKSSSPRGQTIRAALERVLLTGAADAHQLSHEVGIAEREVVGHLEHLARSLPHHGARLVMEPATCLGCGYTFRDRARFEKPGRCPSCRGTRIARPRFFIERRQP